MLTARQVDHSIQDRLADLFRTPPNGFTNPFNVYTAENFFNPLFEPAPPYVWLLSKTARPTKSRIPLVIIQRGVFGWAPFELGNREGQLCSYNLNIFGRNEGEASDLVDFLKKNLDPIPINDYDTEPATELYKAQLENLVHVPGNVGGEIGMEGTLQHQESLAFNFVIKEL